MRRCENPFRLGTRESGYSVRQIFHSDLKFHPYKMMIVLFVVKDSWKYIINHVVSSNKTSVTGKQLNPVDSSSLSNNNKVVKAVWCEVSDDKDIGRPLCR